MVAISANIETMKGAVKKSVYDDRDIEGHKTNDQASNRQRDGHKPGYITQVKTTGWRPTCDHYDEFYENDYPQARSSRKRHQRQVTGNWWKRVRKQPGKDDWYVFPQIVLDPFNGSGTTVEVAQKLGRIGIGLDLSWDYLQLARERTGLAQMYAWKSGKREVEANLEGLPMFQNLDP